MSRRLICVFVFALALAASTAGTAGAHPSSARISLHKIWSPLRELVYDPPPMPMKPCTDSNDGELAEVYDPILDAYVVWECRSGTWFRLRIRQQARWPLQDHPRRWVWDRQRRCKSIVCKSRRVRHHWPTLYALGGRFS